VGLDLNTMYNFNNENKRNLNLQTGLYFIKTENVDHIMEVGKSSVFSHFAQNYLINTSKCSQEVTLQILKLKVNQI
jgi:hypothetical protein